MPYRKQPAPKPTDLVGIVESRTISSNLNTATIVTVARLKAAGKTANEIALILNMPVKTIEAASKDPRIVATRGMTSISDPVIDAARAQHRTDLAWQVVEGALYDSANEWRQYQAAQLVIANDAKRSEGEKQLNVTISPKLQFDDQAAAN